MSRIQSKLILLAGIGAALVMAGCADMNRSDRATATGAAVGGVAGAILTDGSPVGAVAGAVVGGVAGKELQKR
ncbi:MAG: glycine zipper 2TM domain-containing protein [Burkholderiales bacterium]|nr:glycine zipper 2TM domain-containing protein [Burkholderiales bacterium]MDE2393868.1 glycine zipper 2TM domain-containing protein [Burkholderiales bacterium]MDE2456271.1 glycine zipper 2TM domain-containing protein [Burkholderiales bacterium]